jgi:hypothetical protein
MLLNLLSTGTTVPLSFLKDDKELGYLSQHSDQATGWTMNEPGPDS